MTREQDIDRAIQRTKRYWYEDGLAEMAGGVIFTLIGLLFFFEVWSPASGGLTALALPLITIGGAWIMRRVVNGVKGRLTYPRTGYVAYPRTGRTRPRRLATAAVAGVVAVVVSALVNTAPASLAWIPAMQGLVLGAGLLYWGYSLDLNRFYLVAAVSVLVGAGASLAGLGDMAGSATYFVVMGLAFVASGAFALWVYLRNTTPAAD